MTALPSPEHTWALPIGPTIAIAPPTEAGPQTWVRFTRVVAVTAGAALLIGMALSYASAYKAAMTAGYDNPWINHGGWQLRPAHLFPLTLDAPALVGYAGTLALAGRRSAAWARLVLWTSGAATIALQVMDGGGWIGNDTTVKAIIHGWPPAVGLLTAHLLVKILQALGVLVPPIADDERPSALARAWAWGAQLLADIRGTLRALDRGDMDRGGQGDARGDNGRPSVADATEDSAGDSQGDIAGDPGEDTAAGVPEVIRRDIHAVPSGDKPLVNLKLGAGQKRVLNDYLAGDIDRATAARRAKVEPRTITRWAKQAREASTS